MWKGFEIRSKISLHQPGAQSLGWRLCSVEVDCRLGADYLICSGLDASEIRIFPGGQSVDSHVIYD